MAATKVGRFAPLALTRDTEWCSGDFVWRHSAAFLLQLCGYDMTESSVTNGITGKLIAVLIRPVRGIRHATVTCCPALDSWKKNGMFLFAFRCCAFLQLLQVRKFSVALLEKKCVILPDFVHTHINKTWFGDKEQWSTKQQCALFTYDALAFCNVLSSRVEIRKPNKMTSLKNCLV